MKEEIVYNQWKDHRRQIFVPEHFTTDVMQRIAVISTDDKIEFPINIFDLPNRLARWSAVGGLILLGIFRLLYVVTNLLQPHLLMH